MEDCTETSYALLEVGVGGGGEAELTPCDGLSINKIVKAPTDSSSARLMSSVGQRHKTHSTSPGKRVQKLIGN